MEGRVEKKNWLREKVFSQTFSFSLIPFFPHAISHKENLNFKDLKIPLQSKTPYGPLIISEGTYIDPLYHICDGHEDPRVPFSVVPM